MRLPRITCPKMDVVLNKDTVTVPEMEERPSERA